MNPSPLINEAIHCFQSGDRATALDLLHQRLAESPDDISALLWLAGVTQEREEALAALQKVLALDPANQSAQKGLAAWNARSSIAAPEHNEIGPDHPLPISQEAPGAADTPPAEAAFVESALRWVVCNPDLKEKKAHAAKRKALIGQWLRLTAFLAMVSVFVPFGVALARQQNFNDLPWFWLGAGLLADIVIFWLILPFADQMAAAYQQHLLIEKSHERVVEELKAILHGGWLLHQEVLLPGDHNSLDMVLIGPQGVYLLAITASLTPVRNQNERWHRKVRGLWLPLPHNPSVYMRKKAAHLRQYLRSQGAAQFIVPRIVWVGPGKLLVQKPAIPIWQIDNSRWWSQDMLRQGELSTAEVNRVAEALKSACPSSQDERVHLNEEL